MGTQKITPPQKTTSPSIEAFLRFKGHWWFTIIESWIPIMSASPPEALVSTPAKKTLYYIMIPVVAYGYGIGYRPPNLGNIYSQWMILVCHIHHERKPNTTRTARACCTWRNGTHLCKAKMLSRPMSQFGGGFWRGGFLAKGWYPSTWRFAPFP